MSEYPPACPVCNGDCASANPPVIFCPMRNDPDKADQSDEEAMNREEMLKLLAEWERLETAFHDNLPNQGETGDPAHGKALCQFLYDHSEEIRSALRAAPALYEALVEIEALCHQETRQKLLAICHRALAKARGTKNERENRSDSRENHEGEVT